VRLVAFGVLVLGGFLLFELACQVYARAVVFRGFDALRAHPRHYYRVPESPLLAYELLPGTELDNHDKWLRINRWGIRDPDDDLARDRRRVAVLGDSVVFGVNHSQERTISGLLQTELDPAAARVRVFNFGLGGLNLAELVEYLRLKDALYDVDDVVYLLNPNDFARRESVYEGADNGLYRTYRRPWFMSRFFVRKAIYRWMKGGSQSTRWYRWMFDGNAEWGFDALREMADYARDHGIRLAVVLLPAAVALTPGGYELSDEFARISAFLEQEGIPHLDPTGFFARDPALYFDDTDHLQDAGNVEMARLMRQMLERVDTGGVAGR
jgi:hypothetical protein